MIRSIPAETRSTVLICGKCSKKVGGGFGVKGTTRLAKTLRRRHGDKKARKSHILIAETGCLKLCPKNAIVAISSKRPGEWLLIPPRTDLEAVDAVLALT